MIFNAYEPLLSVVRFVKLITRHVTTKTSTKALQGIPKCRILHLPINSLSGILIREDSNVGLVANLRASILPLRAGDGLD
jgi:hypothetical protein